MREGIATPQIYADSADRATAKGLATDLRGFSSIKPKDGAADLRRFR